MSPVPGLSGNIYRLTVFVPNPADLVATNPALKNFQFPPTVGIILTICSTEQSVRISISIRQ